MTDTARTDQTLIRATVLRAEALGSHVETTTVHIAVPAHHLDATDTDWRDALCAADPRTVLLKWEMYQLACALAEAVADRPRPGNTLYYEIRALHLLTDEETTDLRDAINFAIPGPA